MGAAYELLIARAVNPGGALTAATPGTADSFTVRNAPLESGVYLEEIVAKGATAGIVRVRSPRLHDNVQGINAPVQAGVNRSLLPHVARQRLYPQDTLTVELSGGAAETDTAGLIISYQDLPGIAARLASWNELAPRIVNLLGVRVTTAAGATAGDWSAGTAINATQDNLKANTDYAILGYNTSVGVGYVGLRSSDTGNLRFGGPGPAEPLVTKDYFIKLDDMLTVPSIPIINSANRGSTLVFVADTTASTAVDVFLNLAELRS